MKKCLWQEFHLPCTYIFSVPFLPQQIDFLPPHHGGLSDPQLSRLLQSSTKTDPSVGVNGQGARVCRRKESGRKLKLLIGCESSTFFSSLPGQAPSEAPVHKSEHAYIRRFINMHAGQLLRSLTCKGTCLCPHSIALLHC